MLLGSDWLYDLDLALKNTRTNLLHWAWFYDILDMDLKSARITLLEVEWFYDIGHGLTWKSQDYLTGLESILL